MESCFLLFLSHPFLEYNLTPSKPYLVISTWSGEHVKYSIFSQKGVLNIHLALASGLASYMLCFMHVVLKVTAPIRLLFLNPYFFPYIPHSL